MAKQIVHIIGAGVGGLTLAKCLLQSNKFTVKVFEKAPEMKKELGAGFSITTSSILLSRIGYDISHIVHPTSTLVNYTHTKVLGESELFSHMKQHSKFADSFQNMGGGVVRGELLELLVNGLPEHTVVFNKNLIDFHEINDGDRSGAQCTFEDGTEEYCDILVGADGIGSNVRKVLFGEQKPSFSNIGVWYGMSKLDTNSETYQSMIGRAYQIHGPNGQFFISYPCGHEGNVTIALGFPMDVPMREDWSLEGAQEELQKITQEYNHQMVHDIVDNSVRLMKFGLFYREPSEVWFKGPVVLLGDSVHAMLPFIGQGANQAIEDAYTLSKYLSNDDMSLEKAFTAYTNQRKPKTTKLVQAATTVGQYHIESGWFRVLLREWFLRFYHWTGLFQRKITEQWDGVLEDFAHDRPKSS